jgi:hypothetical protein
MPGSNGQQDAMIINSKAILLFCIQKFVLRYNDACPYLLQEEGIPAGNQRWVNGIYRELEIFYNLVISHNHGNDLYKIGRAVGKRADPMQGDTAFKRGMATLLTWRAAVGREEALFPATGRHDKKRLTEFALSNPGLYEHVIVPILHMIRSGMDPDGIFGETDANLNMYTEQHVPNWLKAVNKKLRNGIWSKQGISNLASGEKVTCVSSMLYLPHALSIERAIPGYISKTIERGHGGFQWRISQEQQQSLLSTMMLPATPAIAGNNANGGDNGGDNGGNNGGNNGNTGVVTPQTVNNPTTRRGLAMED